MLRDYNSVRAYLPSANTESTIAPRQGAEAKTRSSTWGAIRADNVRWFLLARSRGRGKSCNSKNQRPAAASSATDPLIGGLWTSTASTCDNLDGFSMSMVTCTRVLWLSNFLGSSSAIQNMYIWASIRIILGFNQLVSYNGRETLWA